MEDAISINTELNGPEQLPIDSELSEWLWDPRGHRMPADEDLSQASVSMRQAGYIPSVDLVEIKDGSLYANVDGDGLGPRMVFPEMVQPLLDPVKYIKLPDGRETQFYVNANGRLSSVEEADGSKFAMVSDFESAVRLDSEDGLDVRHYSLSGQGDFRTSEVQDATERSTIYRANGTVDTTDGAGQVWRREMPMYSAADAGWRTLELEFDWQTNTLSSGDNRIGTLVGPMEHDGTFNYQADDDPNTMYTVKSNGIVLRHTIYGDLIEVRTMSNWHWKLGYNDPGVAHSFTLEDDAHQSTTFVVGQNCDSIESRPDYSVRVTRNESATIYNPDGSILQQSRVGDTWKTMSIMRPFGDPRSDNLEYNPDGTLEAVTRITPSGGVQHFPGKEFELKDNGTLTSANTEWRTDGTVIRR